MVALLMTMMDGIDEEATIVMLVLALVAVVRQLVIDTHGTPAILDGHDHEVALVTTAIHGYDHDVAVMM